MVHRMTAKKTPRVTPRVTDSVDSSTLKLSARKPKYHNGNFN